MFSLQHTVIKILSMPLHVTGKKILFLASLFMTYLQGYSQSRYDWRARIDFLVEQTDSLSMKSQKTFYLPKIHRVGRNFVNDQTIKETWNYTMENGRVIIFQVRYVVDHREYTEVYYLDHDRLICMENYETPYLASYVDEVRRGEMFFLVDNTVRQYVKFGNKQTKEPAPLWDAEYDCVTKFEKRYAELKKYLY
jgi:hypothetical protein